MSFFNANKRVENSSTLAIAIKIYIPELLDLLTVQVGIFVAEHEGWIKKECKLVKKKYLLHVS